MDSRPEVFFKKDVLRNFAKFTGKHPCIKLQACLQQRLLSVSFSDFCFELILLISIGILLQIIDPKYRTDSIPSRVVLITVFMLRLL